MVRSFFVAVRFRLLGLTVYEVNDSPTVTSTVADGIADSDAWA
jgi:hypothetical protein